MADIAERTEEQIARDKAAVDAMRNARSNMDAAIIRIDSLERGLTEARSFIENFKRHVAPSLFPYRSEKSLINFMDEAIAAITKRLG